MTDPFAVESRVVHRFRRTTSRRSATLLEPSAAEPLAVPTTNNYLRSILIVGVLVFGVLLWRLVDVQARQGSTFRARSEGNRVRQIISPAPRGIITDRFGSSLADNEANISMTVVPADIPRTGSERDRAIQHIADLAAMSTADVTAAITGTTRRSTDPVAVKEHLTYDEAIKITLAAGHDTGIAIVGIPNRAYPSAGALSHVLGYTGRVTEADLRDNPRRNPLDQVGKTGLERTYNDDLTGTDGIIEVEHDAQNRAQRIISEQVSQPGHTLTTALDGKLQQLLSAKLEAMVKAVHSTGGAAIAMDPSTGEVLAMTSAPTFDNNWFVSDGHSQDITDAFSNARKPLLNRAISGQYPSGSIIKPLIAAAALTEKTITPATAVNSVGGFAVGRDFFPDWKSGGHGLTNVAKAIAESVNTFFYAVGGGFENISGLGVDRIVRYLQKFGWGQTLGIDLPSEADGFVPTKDWRTTKRPSPWKLGDTYHLSIGQGDLEVTPLQIASYISAIANGGTLWKPHIVTKISTADGATVKTFSPQALATAIVPSSAIATVQNGMRQGVLAGSSRSLQSLPVTSAGKTGTAQFGNEGKTHSWYAAYAPYEKPEIVIAVIVEGGGEGNAAALPVAKDVLQWYFTEGAGKVSQ